MDETQEAAIRARIRQARKDAGLSRKELADMLKVHESSIGNYERDRVPWGELPQIAERTDSDLRWLLFGHAYQDPLVEILERLARLEQAVATVPGASAPPPLPVELGRFGKAAEPSDRKAQRK